MRDEVLILSDLVRAVQAHRNDALELERPLLGPLNSRGHGSLEAPELETLWECMFITHILP
jgi:hypothetical protein